MLENETKKRAKETDSTSKKVEKTDKVSKRIEKIEEKTTPKKVEKKTTSNDFEIENFTKSKAKFRFLLLTEKRKNTDIETLKRLTIIVTVLIK